MQARDIPEALRLAELMRTLEFLPVPTVAMVNGAAMGGGVGLGPEALAEVVVLGVVAEQDLDRDRAVEGLVVRATDRRHPPATDDPAEPVPTGQQLAFLHGSSSVRAHGRRVATVGVCTAAGTVPPTRVSPTAHPRTWA